MAECYLDPTVDYFSFHPDVTDPSRLRNVRHQFSWYVKICPTPDVHSMNDVRSLRPDAWNCFVT